MDSAAVHAASQPALQHKSLSWRVTFAKSQDSSVPDPHRLNRAASSSHLLSLWTYHATCSTGACRQRTTSCAGNARQPTPPCSCHSHRWHANQRQGLLLTMAQTLRTGRRGAGGTLASTSTTARALCRMVKAVAMPEAASAVPTAPLSQPNASSWGRVGCQATAVTWSVRPCRSC